MQLGLALFTMAGEEVVLCTVTLLMWQAGIGLGDAWRWMLEGTDLGLDSTRAGQAGL